MKLAEIFPDEGLDYLLGVTPKNGTNPTNTYCGLFISATASTVPAATAVLASQSGVTETSGWGYARVIHASSGWGTAGSGTIWSQTARRVVGTQLNFAAASAAYAVAINGFFMSAGTGYGTGPAIFFSNFDDTTAIASLSLGDIIKVQPTWGLLG